MAMVTVSMVSGAAVSAAVAVAVTFLFVALLLSLATFFGQSLFEILQCHFLVLVAKVLIERRVKIQAAEWNDVWPVQNSTAIPATKEFHSRKISRQLHENE